MHAQPEHHLVVQQPHRPRESGFPPSVLSCTQEPGGLLSRRGTVEVSRLLLLAICGICAVVVCSCAERGRLQHRDSDAHHSAALESGALPGRAGGPDHKREADIPPPYSPKDTLQTKLESLQRRREELLLRYTELHPDVRLLDAQMRILRQQIDMAHN